MHDGIALAVKWLLNASVKASVQEVAHKQVIDARIGVDADGARLAEIDVGTVGQTHMRLVGECMVIAADTRTVGVEKHEK